MGDINSFTNSFNTLFLPLLLLILPTISNGGTIVRSLPRYPGNLPFRLETGYIGVGKEEEVQLFYYFTESERDPETDPLLLWLTGGPGCSALSGLVLEIGNKAAIGPLMNLKGYILGNPVTGHEEDWKNPKYKFARSLSLLSDELYEATIVSCHGNCDTVDPRNKRCLKNLQAVKNDNDYVLFEVWANELKVREALHFREATKVVWNRCNLILAYTKNVQSNFDYHRNLTKEMLHALIYSGDQDMLVSYVGTMAWIRKLSLSIIDHWRPWFAKAQVAGYTTKYSNGHYHLTYTTVKGAGHTAPEYKPQECLAMLTKWITTHLEP